MKIKIDVDKTKLPLIFVFCGTHVYLTVLMSNVISKTRASANLQQESKLGMSMGGTYSKHSMKGCKVFPKYICAPKFDFQIVV